jgi:GTPase SAR1 family protein
LGAICLTLFKEVIASTMPKTMTPKDRVATVDAMIRTVQIHMTLHNCGNAEVCHNLLAHEDHLVRILASHMYVGDNLGKIRSPMYQEKVPFEVAYGQFIANMDSLPVHTSLVALNPGQKASILLQGQSGSGKSSFVQSLCSFLPECHRPIVISRDKHIAGVITGLHERLMGEQYALMYAIYNACRAYHKEQSKNIARVHDAITKAQNGGLQLSTAFTIITEQSVPNVMKLVDSAFTEAYNNALNNGDVDVIIVDSCLTLWETAVQQHLPRLSETIVITVPIINFAGIVSEANGLDEQGQMRLSGANTLHRPANGEFASSFFDPFGKKDRNTFHQAPPVILTMENGIICTNIGTLKWVGSALGDQPIIHPTRVDTSGMNGGEFIQHLVDKHNGDMLKVREELFKMWDVSMNGIYPYEQHTASKKKRIIDELVAFTTRLHEHSILDNPITKEDLASNDTLFWNTIMSITVVKYKDGHNGSKFWVNEFMRHFRGITIFTHPITRKVTVLRYLMDRGAEIHSKVTNKRATRQDECDTNGTALDHISKCLLEDLTLNAYLTQKADGSLGTATVYSNTALAIMKAYVETWGTDVAKKVAIKSMKMTEGRFMVVVATQGTKSLSDDMTAFATTSIFGGIHDKQGKPLVSREEMSTKTPLQIWEEHGSKVLERIFTVHGSAHAKYPDDSITLMFEMICAENRDAFPGAKYHDEFACSATKDQCLFLGLGYASLEVNIPHCVIDIKGAFQQPAFWKIDNAKQVNEMIRDLQLVMCGKMTKRLFITTYLPVNPMEFDELHPEGFVLYGYVSAQNTAIHKAYALPGILTYAKVKTLIYYMAHKFKVDNLEALVEYGRVSPGHFPLCDVLYSIYSSGKLQQLMTRVHDKVKKMIDMNDEQSPLRLAIANLDTKDGAFKVHPLNLLTRIKTIDPMSSFIGALLSGKGSAKDLALSQSLTNMFTGLFIKEWNTTFETSIQTLEDVIQLEEDSSKLSLPAKARELLDERIALAKKANYALLQTIKEAKPWSEEWQKVATCTIIPTLLKNQLIKQMVELQNKPSIALPTSRAED